MSVDFEISLFGTCVFRTAQPSQVTITGAKHRALFAMLVCAPMGRIQRSHLQKTLWGLAEYESGHQNLRRALSDLRKRMGPLFDDLLTVTTTEVEIDVKCIRILGAPSDGLFLADLNVQEAPYVAWRDTIRADHSTIAALCHLSRTRGPRRIRPRICALPLSVPPGADPMLGVTADWIAEETCRMMSRSSLVSVISHLSGREMSQRFVDVARVRETLGVDYLITGSLRSQGTNWIADLDFIDIETGTLLWNRHLCCPQSEFSTWIMEWLVKVVQNAGRSIAEGALQLGRQTPLPQLPDHKLLIAGAKAMHHPTLRDFLHARQFLDEASVRAPHSAQVQAWLGKWYVLSIIKNYTADRAADMQRALDCTARALDLDPQDSFALTIDGFVNGNILNNFDLAETRYTSAQDINPNESLSWLLRGSLLAFRDEGKSAIKATETARSLSPIDPFGYYFDSLASSAHLSAGNYQRALELADRSIATNDRHISTLRARIAALHALDRGAEALTTAQDLIRRFPEFQLSQYKNTHPSSGNKTGQLVIEALSAAGIT